MAIVTYPLNQIDYTAEDAELYCCTRASGIYAGDDFSCSVTGADNTVTIAPGLAWIRNSRFSGKAAALKSAMALELSLPDSVWPRIDAIVLRFDANSNRTELIVKTGTAASAPAAPEAVRSEALYELHLYHIRREAGAAAVTAGDIADLRLDDSYCGLMADPVTQVDTSAIHAQAQALIAALRAELGAVEDGSAWWLKSETIPVSALGWQEDADGNLSRLTADGETEWLSPPMGADVEYRTTDRWMGKAVYTRLIPFGALPSNGTGTAATGIDGSKVVELKGFSIHPTAGIFPFPLIKSGSADVIGVINGIDVDGTLSVTTTTNLSNITGYFVVRYTRD